MNSESYLKKLETSQALGVPLDHEQWESSELEMYQLLYDKYSRKVKAIEKKLREALRELDDLARFDLSWRAGARESDDPLIGGEL